MDTWIFVATTIVLAGILGWVVVEVRHRLRSARQQLRIAESEIKVWRERCARLESQVDILLHQQKK